jgi:hypothetical protein
VTRRTTLFIVCAFEIALILFVAAWSAQAHECILKDNTADEITIYNNCKADLANKMSGHEIADLKARIDALETRIKKLTQNSDTASINPDTKKTAVNIENVKFEKSTETRAKISLTLKNLGEQEIIAWKGVLKCDDALGDEAFRIELKNRSANIPSGGIRQETWETLAFDGVGKTIQTNDARNFDCEFVEFNPALRNNIN